MKLNKQCFLFTVVAFILFTGSCIKDPQFTPAVIGVNPQTLDLTTEASENTIKLFTNRDWTVEIVSDDEATWLMVSDTAGIAMEKDSLTITISVIPNEGEDRQATVNFRTETIYASVKVSQKGVVQKEYTPISTVRDLYKGSDVVISEDYIIKASVVSNYRTSEYGGLNNATSAKTMIVSDGTSGLSLYLTANNTEYAVGDELAVSLKGMTLQRYNNGSLQVNGLPLTNIEKLGTNVLNPVSITAAQLVTGNYESMYVAVSDVQVIAADMGKKFSSSDSHTSINFQAKTGETFVIFSSKYSTFMDEAVPTGSGILKGVAMVYGTTYQISIAALSDYAGLTGERFTVSGGGGEEGGDGAVIGDYAKWNAITPVSSFGDDFINVKTTKVAYENVNWMFYCSDASAVTNGWMTGIYNTTDKYLQVAPYASSLDEVVAFALIPRINVSAATTKELKFKYTIYYQTADASKFEIVTSEDFSGDFTTATWTVLQDVTIAAEDANKNVWVEKTVDFSSFAAKTTLCVAFRYTGKANTYRLDDVQFNNGTYPEEEGGGGEEGGGDGGAAGDGVYTSNVTMPASDFSDSNNAAYGGTATVGGTSYPMLKLGKSSVAGTYTFAAPLPKTGACTLSFYAVAWKGASTSITVTVNNAGKIDGASSKVFALNANDGATGNPPFTITLGNDYYTAALTEITSATTITVTTSTTGYRAVMLGVNIK